MIIYCMVCEEEVEARLTNGAERYPHRPDLADIPQYTHDACGTWVGTHHKSSSPLKPLGILATKEMFDYRSLIHHMIDMLWKNKHMTRGQVYGFMSRELGYVYHTGEIRTIEEAKRVVHIATKLQKKVIANIDNKEHNQTQLIKQSEELSDGVA